jgi:hypothetical protein
MEMRKASRRFLVGQPILAAAAFQAAFFALLKYSPMKAPFPIRTPRQTNCRKCSRRGVASRRSRLKGGCSQDWLPHQRARFQGESANMD